MILRSFCAALVLGTIGCGGESSVTDREVAMTDVGDRTAATRPAAPTADEIGTDQIVTSPVPEGRKIIFEAHLKIDVEDFGVAATSVDRLVMTHGGFVTASQRGGRSGSNRSGEWTLRVPVEQYRPLIEALTELGELNDQTEMSQEVTDEYYDLEARIKNKQQQEQRLVKHLNETARNLQEILTIETEIGRVRGEVERMQGRLRLLADQTALSTIHLTLDEIQTFVPAETPTFATRLSRAWRGSIDSVAGLLQWSTIAFVAMAPWLALLAGLGVVGLLPAWWLKRRLTHAKLR